MAATKPPTKKLRSLRGVLVCWVLLLALTCGTTVAICAPGTFTISGEVKTEKGRAFPKAVVTIDNELGITTAVFTRSDGRFLVKGLLPGNYRISADLFGYVKVTQTVVIPSRKPISLVLRPAPADKHKQKTDHVDLAMSSMPRTLH